MYDIHSHVLFGIDDGAKSLEQSLDLCRMAAADGVSHIVATPHIREGVWPNRRAGIVERLEEVRAALAKDGCAIEVVLGSELYFASDIVDAVREGEYPSYGDRRRYVLFELPHHFIPRQVQDVVFGFASIGVTPVLAHPERNARMMERLELLEELVGMGTVVQVTAMSVTGRFGRAARKAADRLLARGLAHVIASDAHRPDKRPAILSEARAEIARTWGEERARLLFTDNPQRVIEGRDIDTRPPEPARVGLGGRLRRWLS